SSRPPRGRARERPRRRSRRRAAGDAGGALAPAPGYRDPRRRAQPVAAERALLPAPGRPAGLDHTVAVARKRSEREREHVVSGHTRGGGRARRAAPRGERALGRAPALGSCDVSRRRLALALAAIVLAVIAALLASDLRGWRDAFAHDDLAFAASPRATPDWRASATLPGDPAAALLSVGGDRTLRTGVRLFEASYRTGLGFDSGVSQRRLRSAAEAVLARAAQDADRSEERRVGKECRSRWSPYH